jgi:hypothetical protein
MNSDPDLVIAMPMRDKPTPETERALKHNTPPHRFITVTGLPVDEARNELARKVLALTSDVVVWIDADSWWFPNAIPSLLDVLAQNSEIGVLTGFYGYREAFRPPVVWKRIGEETSFVRLGEDCPQGHAVQIASAGFQMVAMRRSVLERVGDDPFSVADVQDSEDAAFFRRCRDHGIISACHTGVPVVHIGDDGYGYLPGGPRFAIRGKNLAPLPTPKPKAQPRKRTRDYGAAVNARVDAAAAALAGAA